MTGVSRSFSCGSGIGTGNNARTIKNTNGLPSGDSVSICGFSSIPQGWVVTRVSRDFNCGSGIGTGNNARTIKNTNGLPSGSFLNVCGFSSIPQGWVVRGCFKSFREHHIMQAVVP